MFNDDDEGAKVAALSVCLFSARPGIIIGGDMEPRDAIQRRRRVEWSCWWYVEVATVVQ